jgi:hypothetical protein
MHVIFSGEGATDMGIVDGEHFRIGPMAKVADLWMERKLGYSITDSNSFTLTGKKELVAKAKSIKTRNRRGKKAPPETKYFFKNARALARIALELSQESNDPAVIAILFRDADGTASAGRGNWDAKHQSMVAGFEIEQFANGVPMLPKPKSEAWVLCALFNRYQHCTQLENRSGNDRSPNNLKNQLESLLGEPATRTLLNEKIDEGLIGIENITDMPSMDTFKRRLNEVLDQYMAD